MSSAAGGGPAGPTASASLSPSADVAAAQAAAATGMTGSMAAAATAVVAPDGSTGSGSSALWSKSQQLSGEVSRQLQDIYGEHFPLEVRHALAGWLEATFAEDLDTANPQHEEHARSLVVSLVQQLEAKAAETSDFVLKNKLDQIIESFKVRAICVTFLYIFESSTWVLYEFFTKSLYSLTSQSCDWEIDEFPYSP